MANRPGRPRKGKRKDWPLYMYKNSSGTFWFRHPNTGEVFPLGSSESEAINAATRLNRSVVAPADAPQCGVSSDIVENDGLFSLTHISGGATPISNSVGIYFLVALGTVVYVGQSSNCGRRILEHLIDPTKTFDSYFVIECAPSLLNELEQRYVSKFSPYLNINIPGRRTRSIARASKIIDAK